jgi:hypothetical protein
VLQQPAQEREASRRPEKGRKFTVMQLLHDGAECHMSAELSLIAYNKKKTS